MQLNGIQALTARRLEQLTASDLRNLATFAKSRLLGLPQNLISAEDVVQKTLLHIIREQSPAVGQPRAKWETKRLFCNI